MDANPIAAKILIDLDRLIDPRMNALQKHINEEIKDLLKLAKTVKRRKVPATKLKALTDFLELRKPLEVTSFQIQASSTRLSAVHEGAEESECEDVGAKTKLPAPNRESRFRRAAAEVSLQKCQDAVKGSLIKKLRRPTNINDSSAPLKQSKVKPSEHLAGDEISTTGKKILPQCLVSLKRLSAEEIKSWDEETEDNNDEQVVPLEQNALESRYQSTFAFPTPPSLESTSGGGQQLDSAGRKEVTAGATCSAGPSRGSGVESAVQAIPVSNEVEEQAGLKGLDGGVTAVSKTTSDTPAQRISKEPLETVAAENGALLTQNIERRSSLRKSKEIAKLDDAVEMGKLNECEVKEGAGSRTDGIVDVVMESPKRKSKLVSNEPMKRIPLITLTAVQETGTTSLRKKSLGYTTTDEDGNQATEMEEDQGNMPIAETTNVENKRAIIELRKLSLTEANEKQTPPGRKSKQAKTKMRIAGVQEAKLGSFSEEKSSGSIPTNKDKSQPAKSDESSDQEVIISPDLETSNTTENKRTKPELSPEINDKQTPPNRKSNRVRNKTRKIEESSSEVEITLEVKKKRTRTKIRKENDADAHDFCVPEESKRTRTKARKKNAIQAELESFIVEESKVPPSKREVSGNFRSAEASFSMPAASSTPRGHKRKSDRLDSPCIEELHAARSRTKVLPKPTVAGPPIIITCSSSAHDPPPIMMTQVPGQPAETTRMTRTKTRLMKEASENDAEAPNKAGPSGATTQTNKPKRIKIDKENTVFRRFHQMPMSEKKPYTTPLKSCNSLFTPAKVLPASAKTFNTVKNEAGKMNNEYYAKILEKLEKEETAMKKKEEHVKSVSEKAKKNLEVKKQKFEAQKRILEEEKREQEQKLEKERMEKEQQVRAEKERQREEIAKKKKINQLKLREAENRRQKEEQAKLLRIKEQEEEAKRLAEIRQRQEEEAERLAKQRLADQQKLLQTAKTVETSKPAAVSKGDNGLIPASSDKPALPLKSVNDYGLDDCQTDDSSDDEDRPKKVVPSWAEGYNRGRAIQLQGLISLDAFTKLMVVVNKAPTTRELLQVDIRHPRNSSFHWPSSPIESSSRMSTDL